MTKIQTVLCEANKKEHKTIELKHYNDQSRQHSTMLKLAAEHYGRQNFVWIRTATEIMHW